MSLIIERETTSALMIDINKTSVARFNVGINEMIRPKEKSIKWH